MIKHILLTLALLLQTQQGAQVQIGGPAQQGTQNNAVWAYVQTSSPTGCPSTGTTCTITVGSTTASSVLVGVLTNFTGSAKTFATGSGGGGSWVLCATSGCSSYNVSGSRGVDLIYNITGTGGATSLTFTYSAVCTSCSAFIGEWKCVAHCGTNALDSLGTNANSGGCLQCSGSSFSSLSGPSDLLVQIFTTPGDENGNIIGPYQYDSIGAFFYALSSTYATAPIIPIAPTSSVFVTSALAFKGN